MKNAHHFTSGDTSIDQKRSISSVADSVILGIPTFRAKNDKNDHSQKLRKPSIDWFLCELNIGDYRSNFLRVYIFTKVELQHRFFPFKFRKIFRTYPGGCF